MNASAGNVDSVLPILARQGEIEAALRSHRVLVICGETGSGKTTQLPKIVMGAMASWAGGKSGRRGMVVGHTQPRRLAARSVAARIAEEMGERLGETVGAKVRFSDQTGPRTRIKVMTDGILLAELGTDPDLREYGAIIIDEAHERSLNIDFLLGYLRTLTPRRDDLRVVITSATIEPRRMSEYMSSGIGEAVPVIEVSGRTYPIEVRYRGKEDQEAGEVDYEAIADGVEELASPRTGAAGDILVFVPGEREIRLARDAIGRRRLDLLTLPLFSRLTDHEQDLIFHPGATGGRRRVIVATNVAETSLTVPGIRHVIDTGMARLSRYDPARKVQRLPVDWISRASADQRAGRCGRLGPGVCVRLYDEGLYRARSAFTEPEIQRTNLASVILRMKSLGERLGPIETFGFLDSPSPDAIRDGYETLFELGAIRRVAPTDARDGDEGWDTSELTPIGERLAALPVDPRIGRMLIAAQTEGTLEETLVLAGVLSIQDPRERPMGKQEEADRAHAVFRHGESDFLTLLNIWEQYRHIAEGGANVGGRGGLAGWCRDRYLSPARMREWSETVWQLRSMTRDLDAQIGAAGIVDTSDDADSDETASQGTTSQRSALRLHEDAIHRTLLTGLISQVACREGASGSFEYRGVRGNVVHLFPGSVLFKRGPKWIVAAEIVQTTRLFARTVGRIEPEWIEQFAGHMLRVQRSDRHLDAVSGDACAWERVTMSTIVVVPRREVRIAPQEPETARQIFLKEALGKGRWETPAAFMEHNRAVLRAAKVVEAKVRRHGAVIDDEQLGAWFGQRVPQDVCTAAAFERWRAAAEAVDASVLCWSLRDVLRDDFVEGLDEERYPNELRFGTGDGAVTFGVEYALAAGKDEDGITLVAPLRSLTVLQEEWTGWLVPGWTGALVQALLKTARKDLRTDVERVGGVGAVSEACAEVMTFGIGTVESALAEALQVLYGISASAGDFQRRALPMHLRPRVRVVDSTGTSIGVDRDLASLQKRFAARAEKEQAAARSAVGENQGSRGDGAGGEERTGIVAWTFGRLDDSLKSLTSVEALRFGALIDMGESVSLTRVESQQEAAALTALGVRRLFALRCAEEVSYSIEAMPGWSQMCSQYAAIGTAKELRGAITAIVAGRAYLDGQSMPLTREEFEDRVVAGAARLHVVVREVGEVIGPMFEHRSKVAHRLSGGTSKLWAESVADMREQAAYLMPRGFLTAVPWDRLRRYTRYVRSMRERLFSLRDEGLQASLELLRVFLPHWKRYTGAVSARMSESRAAKEAAGEEPGLTQPSGERKSGAAGAQRGGGAPLPAARRAAPTVNVDAGEWAIQPGRVSGALDAYRWALEEWRVLLFTPELTEGGRGPALTENAIRELWDAVERDAAGVNPSTGAKGKHRRSATNR